MRIRFALLSSGLLALGVAAACSSSSNDSVIDSLDAGGGSSTDPPPTTTPPATTLTGTGLPCDVEGVLANRCVACHTTGPTPVAIATYDAAMARSPKDPSKSIAEASLAEMVAKTMPRPPAEPAAADEIETVAAWLDAGAPRNPTACTDPAPDAGTDAGAIVSRCTSGKRWERGDRGDDEMHPGAPCLACHAMSGGPSLRIAGTVYPTLHEPTDCNGTPRPPNLTVVVTDSRNRTFRLNVNGVGNFNTRDIPRPPLTAVVTDGQKTRAMVGKVTSGDCNSCHTEAGANGAPGRIMAP